MSRKRKRRGRGPTMDADTAQGQDQSDGIEIVDDVNILGDQETVSGGAAPQEAANTVARNASTDMSSGDSGDAASGPVDSVHETSETASTQDAVPAGTNEEHSNDVVVADAGAQVVASAVHVVEPLHESPQASSEGDRTVETLGELLQHAREARGLSLEEVSARTRIALPTLRHLENDRFGELPAEAYVKGFLRSYGSFLSLDVSMLLRRYEKLSGHVSTPVAEIWDEVDVDRSSLHVWRPSRRTVAIAGAVLVVAALAWVFWSQGAVMLGLRPAGELQQIEMQLQREAQQGDTPQTSITGLDDAALQQDADKSTGSGVRASDPPSTAGPSTKVPATENAKLSTVEDTSPPVPQPPVKPAVASPTRPQAAATPDAQAKKPSAEPMGPEAPKPAPTEAEKKATVDAAKKPPAAPVQKPVQKPVKKPVQKVVKKAAPAPSPEDAAGPPG